MLIIHLNKGFQLNITVVDIDPVMKRVAEKWYGFQESNLHRIVIDDGIEYSRKASEKGEKFDAILLDLCTNERRPLLCPIEEFLTETALESLASILSDTDAHANLSLINSATISHIFDVHCHEKDCSV
ncbi:hypothetical protein NECAME_00392 [Necator americanus]|uniref:PABS domain-containing protein n=1 Tax=Necator americanus TaxID=51031 RepID=W2TAY3_NECAM|nr:hypothetical protein NECAME_00392 [Necator americanus]ETN79018.1 hypothetical protein NECAME_00392 [Necator americanus]